MTLDVETVHGRDAMEALREEWELLRARTHERSPFLSFEWFRCCLEDLEGAEALLLLVRHEGRLVGLAPLARRTVRLRRLRARAIEFVRCRETAYADVLALPERRDEILGAMFQYLFSKDRIRWDALRLGPWPEDSANLSAARRWLGSVRASHTESTMSLVPVTRMNGDWDALLAGRSYLFRKSRRGILNRMRRLGNIEVECHRSDEEGTVLRSVFEVSDRSWKRDEQKAVTSRPESKRFFEALTAAAASRGWLMVWLLRWNGVPVATEYDLVEDGVVYAIRADYDRSYHQHSPGAYLEYQLLQRLCAEGHSAYHAGPGTDEYKLRWTEERRRTVSLTVYNRHSLVGTLAFADWRVESRLRRLRDRLRPRPAAQEPAS